MAISTTATTKVLVLGAGLAGLSAASQLRRQGIDVEVLEAAPRVGGRVLSQATSLDSMVDLGGHWLGHDHHRMTKLAKQAGAEVYPSPVPSQMSVILRHRLINVFSPAIVLAALYIVFIDIVSRVYVPRAWKDISIEQAISRAVPTESARQFLRLIVMVSSSVELEHCSLYAFASSLHLSGGIYTMLSSRGGSQDSLITESTASVVEMLVKEIGASRIHTGSAVIKIQQDADGVIVHTSNSTFRAGRVVVAMSPTMHKSIVFEPPLPEAVRTLQQNTRMGVVYKAIAVFSSPFWRANRRASDILVLDDPPCSVSDTSPPSGRPGHLCMLIAGTPARQLDDMDIESRRDLLLSRLRPALGPRVLEPVEWHEKSWQMDEFCGGGYLAYPVVGSEGCFLPMVHMAVGRMHWAGTETADEHPGYMEGAVQSGERAASEVIKLLCRMQALS